MRVKPPTSIANTAQNHLIKLPARDALNVAHHSPTPRTMNVLAVLTIIAVQPGSTVLSMGTSSSQPASTHIPTTVTVKAADRA